MSFTGQINFGYPITSQNIITDIPNNAVLPLAVVNSLQGNILGVTFETLKSELSANSSWGSITGNIYEQSDLINLFNNKQNILYSGSNIKTINGNSILGGGNLTVGVTDGDKGDVTVSGGGNTWTVDNLPQSRINNLTSDLAGKQANLGFTPEDVSNKQSNLTASSTKYPTIDAVNTGLSTKENTITTGTTSQYWRGDKSWQTLDKTAVGLSNVPNTDATNPANITQSATYRFVSDTEKSTWNGKQATLTSGTNIKTINGSSILGSGDLTVGMPDFIEYNTTDKTVWNNGKGNIATNTSFGEFALSNTTSGLQNAAFGYQALNANTTGSENVALGYQALLSVTTNTGNVAVGNEALKNNTSGQMVAVGYAALRANTTGLENTAVGYQTLNNNTTGSYNSAFGYRAMLPNTTGGYNSAFGHYSLVSNSTGNYNNAFGYQALRSNTTGTRNTAFGYQVLYSNTTGVGNVALGPSAASILTTGNLNVVLGSNSGGSLTTGSNNTIVGNSGGATLSTGSYNVFIGAVTQGPAATTGSIVIGSNAGATEDNQMVIGSSTYPAGAIATETITPNRTWTVRINGFNYKIPLLAI